MRNRLIAAVLLAAVLVTGLGAALASPGAPEDPFITLSYLTGTFIPEMEKAMLEQAQTGTSNIEKSALERLAILSDSYLARAERPEGLYADKFLRLILARNEKLILSPGSSLQFEEGVVSLAFSSGCLIDTSDGTVVTDTGTLKAGHHYIAAEDTTCTVIARSDAVYLSVRGFYKLERTNVTYTPFSDIVAPIWYADSVLYAYQEGLVNGMTPTTFEPSVGMNRAMLVTLLSRMAGVQGTPPDAGFIDVPANAWYAASINWAYSVGIITGTSDNNTFSPTAPLTREQMAVFLYRYTSIYLNLDAPCTGDLSRFPDVNQVHNYAKDAFSWAVGVGLVNGKDGRLAPQDQTNRAEVATILYRFNMLFPY